MRIFTNLINFDSHINDWSQTFTIAQEGRFTKEVFTKVNVSTLVTAATPALQENFTVIPWVGGLFSPGAWLGISKSNNYGLNFTLLMVIQKKTDH
jgi:hypothetical protein